MVVVVGAGISGAVVARELAEAGQDVLVVEQRNRVGGNCADAWNHVGLLVPLHGPHFFHTGSAQVWEYVQRFATWIPFEFRGRASIAGKLVPMPVNLDTVNLLFDLHLETEEEMRRWLDTERLNVNPRNSEEMGLSRFGPRLYRLLFENYTLKQWGRHPSELAASVVGRIPIRYGREDRYFSDPYQGIPAGGYTQWIANILRHPRIEVRLGMDYFASTYEASLTVFTGRVDQYFRDSGLPPLPYRSLHFEHETLRQESYQGWPVVTHPAAPDFTRVTEPKMMTGQRSAYTTIIREYPSAEGLPYYPIPSPETQELYEKYQRLAEGRPDLLFLGRLASYRYINMDEAVEQALAAAQLLKRSPKPR